MGLDALGSGAHRCEAVALTSANVCEVPFDDLTGIAAEVPTLQQQLLRSSASAWTATTTIWSCSPSRPTKRIATVPDGLGERLRHVGLSPTDIRLPMSREDIASFLGLALETVSRGFGRLQDDGVIAVHGRRVEILDMEELLRLAQHGQESPPPQVRARPIAR